MEKSKARKSYLIVAMLLLLVLVSLGIGFVVAYGGSSPSVIGHNLGELNLNCVSKSASGASPATTVTVICDTDDRLISGGCIDPNGQIKESIPAGPTAPNNPTGWRCTRVGTTGTIQAYALCCDK